MNHPPQYQQLVQRGFCKFGNILPPTMVARLEQVTRRLAEAQTAAQVVAVRAQGSMIPTTADPLFAELIAWRPALDALATLGFSHPTFTDGYVISKPGHSPRLFWHYDWFAWEDPGSYEARPQQLFLMYYLSDTTRHNGCLRVIPGSHLHHNVLHDLLAAPHSQALSEARRLNDVAFSTRPDEEDVPVRSGELLIGDARLLHAAHENTTHTRRSLITLWYQPDFTALSESVQAQMAAKVQLPPTWWPPEARALMEPLLPRYQGSTAPLGRSFYRRK